MSDLLLHSVNASGSLAAAGCHDLQEEDNSLLEGTSLLEDFEALPVDRTAENVQLFQYVFTATPVGEPSVPVQKALVSEFEKVRLEEDAAAKIAPSIPLGSTPMGVPSGPVAKSLVYMFDQCLSPSPPKDRGVPASSPGKAAREEMSGSDMLRSVVKRLAFPSEEGQQTTKTTSEATLSGSTGDSSAEAAIAAQLTEPRNNASSTTASSTISSRPMSAAITRPAKTAVSSRPMSAVNSRMPAATTAGAAIHDRVPATKAKAAACAPTLVMIYGGADGGVAASDKTSTHSKRTTPTMAWSVPKLQVDPHQETKYENTINRIDMDSGALELCSGAGVGTGGGLFSAARAQARAQREGSGEREQAASVKLAPPIRSPTETGACTSPLTLFGSSTGMNGGATAGATRQRASSRPPSAAMSRAININRAARAASVSPNRQMFGSIGMAAAREALASTQPACTGSSGWLPQQQRRSPPPSSTATGTADARYFGAATGNSPAVGAGGAALGVGRSPKVMLNNKMDLMASVRLARRTQVLCMLGVCVMLNQVLSYACFSQQCEGVL